MSCAHIWVSSCDGVGVCSPKRMISLDKQDGPPDVYRPQTSGRYLTARHVCGLARDDGPTLQTPTLVTYVHCVGCRTGPFVASKLTQIGSCGGSRDHLADGKGRDKVLFGCNYCGDGC